MKTQFYNSGLDSGVSAYLDLLRVCAALVVLLHHYLQVLFGVEEGLLPGHDAVVVFFVLSGYVIAYVADQKERDLFRFAIHRLARLWSVLIPALILALAVELLAGKSTISIAPSSQSPTDFALATVQNLMFVGEWWFFPKSAPLNAPVWSLNYEAWYYIIFAAFVFARPRWRWYSAALAMFLAGPRIAPLMPCWLVGVLLYKRRYFLVVNPSFAYALLALSALTYWMCYHFELTYHSRQWLKLLTAGHSYRLGPATSVIGDLIIAPLVGITIIGITSAPWLKHWLRRCARVLKLAASRTLSLYLYHMPVLVFLHVGLGLGTTTTASKVFCLLLGVSVVIVLGHYTEGRLTQWRNGLFAIWRCMSLSSRGHRLE